MDPSPEYPELTAETISSDPTPAPEGVVAGTDPEVTPIENVPLSPNENTDAESKPEDAATETASAPLLRTEYTSGGEDASAADACPSLEISEEEQDNAKSKSPLPQEDAPDPGSSFTHPDANEASGDGGDVNVTVKLEAPGDGLDCTPRWTSTTIETYAIQCSACLKWRIIPTKAQYETIGETILEQPFLCLSTRAWREDITCDGPSDLEDDEPTILWAVDKHNIPRPPQGFHRKVVLRGENSSKFADVYYKAPCGKTLRSMVQVQKYLEELPNAAGLGVHMSQFSFTSPKPRPGMLKKRSPPQVTSEPVRQRMKGSIAMGNPSDALALLAPPHSIPPPLLPPHPPAGHDGPSSSRSRELCCPKPPTALVDQRIKRELQAHAALNPLMAVKVQVAEELGMEGKAVPEAVQHASIVSPSESY